MEKRFFKALIAVVLLSVGMVCGAQSIPVGSVADQYLRFLQLLDSTGNNSGMVNRPYMATAATSKADSAFYSLLRTHYHFSKSKKGYIGVLPLALNQQYVSHHPLAQNDGAMIEAKGYQLQLSGGVYGKIGPLHVQLAPELVVAANSAYDHNAVFGAQPTGGFRKLYPGQSFVRLNAGPVALSLASENLWWGPGVYHSLVMSNQAPGFMHFKLHSSKPLKTPIGNFEWTLLGGRLTSEKKLPYDNDFLRYNVAGQVPANRYLNAYTISYLPKFLPGLSVGASRSLQQYEADVKASKESVFSKYMPVILKPVQKKNAQDDDAKSVDQVASAFFRWLFKKSAAEVYGEYGFNDYKKNIRDYVMNLPHSAAYLVGFKKAFTLTNSNFIETGAEITQISQSTDRMVRNAGNWYTHGTIWEGHTNENQGMGAAFATDAQTFYIAKRSGLKRTALTMQRLQHDPDRVAAPWNDWVIGMSHSQFLKGFYVDGQLQLICSQNYAWQLDRNPVQVLAKAGIRYYFHD